MVFNTISRIATARVNSDRRQYLNRKPLRQKPTAHVSYHEGINLIRQFLKYASHHTVEDLQGFTSQWVPSPRWVKVDEVTIPQKYISDAASTLCVQLGHRGIDKVGGEKWWQWRREGSALQAEWIEMRRDYTKRKQTGGSSKRVILYVHGGAYFFGSVDEHRYQMQRHARKLEARVFARVAGDGSFDYIPAHGFLHRPSAAWPPPNADDMEQVARSAIQHAVDEALPRRSSRQSRKQAEEEAVQGFSVDYAPEHLESKRNADNPAGTEGAGERPGNTIPGAGHHLSIMLDGKLINIKDQIQMYTTNQLISHPLVSPVLQPSLGGLPPLLIITGGGEVLGDEQIYLAHKAANPSKYPPGDAYLNEYPDGRELLAKWKPTDVQLQVWDDLCHVAPTLSFTRPAKFMYRSIAQFGAWVLARAQHTEIEIQDDDDVSVISSGSESELDSDANKMTQTKATMDNGVTQGGTAASDVIGKAGQPLPPFKNHMIRQRVDRHGNIFPLDPPSALPALQMSANEIGVIKPGPVQKWLNAKQQWESRYAKEKRKVQKQRAKEMARGFQGFGDDEVPPPSALAGRRGLTMPKEEKKGRSWGMTLWSLWGSSHDEHAIEREEKVDKGLETATATETDGASTHLLDSRNSLGRSTPKSRRRTVTYNGQDEGEIGEHKSPAIVIQQERTGVLQSGQASTDQTDLPSPTITTEHSSRHHAGLPQPKDPNRPSAGGIAFPFKFGSRLQDDGRNASTITLISQGGVVTPKADENGAHLGENIGNEGHPGLNRRVTMEDANGVLHKRLVAWGAEKPSGEKYGSNSAEGKTKC
ncbi:MAG: hypothetical protein Q9217_004245 [Psora testacea]